MRAGLRLSLVAVLAASVFAPAAAGSAPVCAAQASGVGHAALVVDTGGGTTTYCVALDATSVSGIRLIQLAGSQFGLRYRLGFGGQAVCQLSGIGPSGGDCFADYPDFWGYWHGDGRGGWSWAGSGAASASIGDGDMEGWVWGSGDSAATHEAPPALALDDVCDDSSTPPPPTPPPGDGGGGDGGGNGGGPGGGDPGGGDGTGDPGSQDDRTASPEVGSGSDDPDDGADEQEEPGRDRAGGDDPQDQEASAATPGIPSITSATPITALAGGRTGDDGGGPPAGALVAAIGVLVLGAGGWLLRRRQTAAARSASADTRGDW